jgi:hypothetical protein
MGGCISLATTNYVESSKTPDYDESYDNCSYKNLPYYRYDKISKKYKSKISNKFGVSFRSKKSIYYTDTPYKKWCE